MNAPESVKPPSRQLLLMEVRALAELSAFNSSVLLLRQICPKGDGHPVLVMPGLGASDMSTRPLRAFLRDRGYQCHGWKMGNNFGLREGVEERIDARLDNLYERYQRKVSLVGWSLGGVFAREASRRSREKVRCVISLGSPFAGPPRATNAWRLYETLSQRSIDDWPAREIAKTPPPVPSTAIFSRTDGIVAWQGCLERKGPRSENIEVEGSHCGLGHNPAVLYAIADRLAQAEGQWKPFDRSGLRRYVFPDPQRASAGSRFAGLFRMTA